ncbi:EscU/YscU/HrcU family type III secretion system export apparatus switch protein, partial [Nostoc sp. NIES-2111]
MAEENEQEDRTEDPTFRKLEQAIERGDVARSMEVNTWFVLAGATLGLMIAGGDTVSGAAVALRGFLANAHAVPMDGTGPMAATVKALSAVLAAVAVPFALLVVFGLAGGLVQHRMLFTVEPMTPQLSRISPISGFKRVFGKEALVQFVKGLLKIAVVGFVMWMVLWPDRDRLESFAGMDVLALLPATRDEALKLMGGVLAIYAFIAGAYFLYQRFTWFNRQRMTMQELKQEYKETEGNPEVKAKLRQ